MLRQLEMYEEPGRVSGKAAEEWVPSVVRGESRLECGKIHVQKQCF